MMKRDFGQNSYVFKNARNYTTEYVDDQASAKGVAVKTLLLMATTFISALLAIAFIGPLGIMQLYLPIVIIDFVLVFAISFSPKLSKYLAIPYSILEGLMVGAVVGMLEMALPDIGFSISSVAFILTIAVFLGACALYMSGALRVTTGIRKFLFTAMLGLLFASLAVGIIGIFSPSIWAVFNFGPLAIVVSLIYVAIASIYVLISLDNAYMLVNSGLSKDYEWYASFGIVVNVIWLFYEILRFLILIFASSESDN